MAQLELGSTIGGYRIESVAGRGGMGVVYVATQLRLNRRVALKAIAPDLAEDPGFRERFTHESQIAASIDHPNVIPVYEAGEQDGLLYLSMRYVEGTDLGKLLKAEGRVEARRAANILAQVAEALDAAHARGLVHRDVKPGNILIAAGDRTYLTDFGLTKHAESASGLTKTGTWVGTVDYVAPEQIRGDHVDARADVYALGCVLFHAMSGQVPFPRPSEVAKIYAHMQDDPPAVDWAGLGVPAGVDQVVRRAMAKDPAVRFQSAGDLGRAVVAATEQRPQPMPERTVAAGDAAPVAATTAAGLSPTGTGATQALPPQPYAPPPQHYPGAPPPYGPPPPPDGPRGPSKLPLILVGLLLLLAGGGVAIAAATGAFEGDGGTTTPTTPTTPTTTTATTPPTTTTKQPPTTPVVSESAVLDVLGVYEQAYSDESIAALDTVLAPDFKRRAPPRPDMGRAEALREYQRQFDQLDNPRYNLSNVQIESGPNGAVAEANYEIAADGAAPAFGTITFSLVSYDDGLLIETVEARAN
jgi:serine/threonine-protein kinase